MLASYSGSLEAISFAACLLATFIEYNMDAPIQNTITSSETYTGK
jgi:hypothetical protein